MYLLNTTTIKLEEFRGSAILYYAILSHRWDSVEASFSDMRDGKGLELAGYSKIKRCCVQSALDGWQYVWIDSCCIDKSSSAELSEAINSMFQWYRDAQVCYAYLSDVPGGERFYEKALAFRNSQWFTRGWTLQELLAPSTVVFFDYDWVEIGTKSSLEGLISSITGIESLRDFNRASVAQKMSWASKRKTTRVEDMAYCLLGLFGLNMAPLYGEGEKAFIRLQLEILSKIDDESIFAWTTIRDREQGLLARSPVAFQHSGDIQRVAFEMNEAPYSMTNKWLRLELVLYQSDLQSCHMGALIAPLNCARRGDQDPLAIYLKRKQGQQFERRFCDKLISFNAPGNGKAELVYVRQPYDLALGFYQVDMDPRLCVFFITAAALFRDRFSILKRYLSTPDHSHWGEQGGEGLFISELVLNMPTHYKDAYGALLFSDSATGYDSIDDLSPISEDDDSDVFVVLLKKSRLYGGTGVNIFAPKTGESLEKNVYSFYARQSYAEEVQRLDRVSMPLKSGRSVSVALRKRGDVQTEQYVVDITIDVIERLRWPDTEGFDPVDILMDILR
jgi:hypothetical protein